MPHVVYRSASSRDLAYGGVFGATGLLLPILFHALHFGSIFMPMYLPLIALAFLVRPAVSGVTALLVPLLSSMLTGMPPLYPPVAPVMALELALMALCISTMARWWPRLNILAILIPVLVLGRFFNAGAMYALSRPLGLPTGYIAGISFISGWPGVILMLLVIPPVCRMFKLQARQSRAVPLEPQPLASTRAYFDSIAHQWDTFDDPIKRRERLRNILGQLRFKDNEMILDIGCGTGTLTRLLLEALPPSGRIIALDLSSEMVTIAGARLRDPRVTWLICDAASTSLVGSCIDRMLCYSTWPHFRDPDRVADELLRVLKPGGTLDILHSEARSVVNAIHRQAGSAVARDILVPAVELGSLLDRHGFVVTSMVDTDERFTIAAARPA